MTNGIRRQQRWTVALMGLVALAGAIGLSGCAEKPQKPTVRHPDMPPLEVPDFLKGTILETAELQNTDPFLVSGFGLVVHLRGTGDSHLPGAVRDYMIKEMVRRGFGTNNYMPEYKQYAPERVLLDPSVAVVQVEAVVPPGARVGQRVDAVASAIEGNSTTSLAHGRLYQCELRINGADRVKPEGSVNAFIRVDEGQIFVNPHYSVADTPNNPRARASLRQGVVMDSGVVLRDRPLTLRLRRPQYALSKSIDFRLNNMFQKTGSPVASAQDDGLIHLTVPHMYRGDWEHFAGVVLHTYISSNVGTLTARARSLAEEAVKPNAPLQDISYCWEAIGVPAMQFIQPLMTHPDPAVQFAAARAAVFIEDGPAQTILTQIAGTPGHPFQVNAVQALGSLPYTPAIGQMLRQVLDTSQPLVRLEAYRILARNKHPSIVSMVIREKFLLDFVPCAGPPMVYASRTGMPRIAIFGDRPTLALPMTFTAMDNTLSISSTDNSNALTLFYRGSDLPQPVSQRARPDLVEIIARLGGEVGEGDKRFDFSYGDIIGILQALSTANKVYAPHGRERVAVSFMLQELPGQEDRLHGASAVAETDNRGPGELPDLPVADPNAPRTEPGVGPARPQ